MVWDLSKEEESLIASSGIGDDSHREPVSKVHWVPDTSSASSGKYNVSYLGRQFTLLIRLISTFCVLRKNIYVN